MALSNDQRTVLRKALGADSTTLPNNTNSIKQFQRFHHLKPDGIVGPKTRAKMQQVNTTLGNPRFPHTGGGAARRSMKPSNGGYGPTGNDSYRPIEDQRGGQAEKTAYDRQAASYYAKRGTAKYTK
jgi:peptidoglycan hydrolase-like protein with peptidoglycan-binding domain